MDGLYAAIGRRQVELEQMHAEYDRLLCVLSQVSTGEIGKEQLEVDLTARTWKVVPKPAA